MNRVILNLMKDMMRKFKQSAGIWLVLVIVLQTILYVVFGASKAYFHMDEIYSYGLSNYDQVQIYETEGFYNTWHSGDFYDDYLTVGNDERGNFSPVYNNQRDDVHPPLFYFLLRLGMELTPEHFTKWTGLILNIIIAAINTVVMYLVVRRLVDSGSGNARAEQQTTIKAVILTAVVALGLAMIGTVMYIRMYMLLTLMVSITTYLYLKLLETKSLQPRLLVGIGIVQLLGALTQYYYWFYVVALFGFMAVHYLRQKRYKEWWVYFATVVGSGLISLLIWPHSIAHMFFGYRGEGVMATLLQPFTLLENLWTYAGVLNEHVFHKLLFIIVLILMLVGGYALIKQKKIKVGEVQSQRLLMVIVPTLFYLLIVAAASPFETLRYIAPVCGVMVVLVMYGLWVLAESVWGKKKGNIVMGIFLVIFSVIVPVAGRLEPDAVYWYRSGLIERFAELHDVPTLYVFKTGDDWGFLNDILLVREMDRSYLAQNLGGSVIDMKMILQGEDLSNGLIVFINDGQDVEAALEAVKKATGLEKTVWTERLVMSDVWYLTKY